MPEDIRICLDRPSDPSLAASHRVAAPPRHLATPRGVGSLALAIALLAVGAAKAQETGLQVEDRSVETKANGACTGQLSDSTQRYAACGDGTVYDTITGLLWLEQVDCADLGTAGADLWVEAKRDAADLQAGLCGLSDASQPGDWRLPTEKEWQLAVAAAVALDCVQGGLGGAPSITDDAGTGCYGAPGASSSFAGTLSGRYWAAESWDVDPGDAWFVDLDSGTTSLADKGGLPLGPLGIWPVREGGGPGPPGQVVVDGGVVETRVRANCLAVLSNLSLRYVACGDGTVLDLHTGLVWLADASCKELAGTDQTGRTDWPGALAAAAALADGTCGLSDGSQPGDWRLATPEEWEETMERAFNLVCLNPALTNAPGDACHAVGPTLFIGVEDFYWTRDGANPDEAWLALANLGITFPDLKFKNQYVWPVRAGR